MFKSQHTWGYFGSKQHALVCRFPLYVTMRAELIGCYNRLHPTHFFDFLVNPIAEEGDAGVASMSVPSTGEGLAP